MPENTGEVQAFRFDKDGIEEMREIYKEILHAFGVKNSDITLETIALETADGDKNGVMFNNYISNLFKDDAERKEIMDTLNANEIKFQDELKKKYNTEVDSNLIENMKNSLEFYKKLSDDNQARLEAVLERNEKLEARNDKLETEIAELRKTVMTMVSSICLDLSCILRKRDVHLIAHPEDIEKTLEENANNG